MNNLRRWKDILSRASVDFRKGECKGTWVPLSSAVSEGVYSTATTWSTLQMETLVPGSRSYSFRAFCCAPGDRGMATA